MSNPGTQYSLFESAEAMPVEQPVGESAGRRFSDYVIYVDESGDHALSTIDPEYPVFVLALCIFHKRHYSEKIIPAVEKLKFNYFGHDSVVLHEHEIRKQKGEFAFLSHRPTRMEFMGRLSSIMDTSNFILMACVVDKARLGRNVGTTSNPDGHFKFPHLWPVKLPQAGRPDYELSVMGSVRAMREAASLSR